MRIPCKSVTLWGYLILRGCSLFAQDSLNTVVLKETTVSRSASRQKKLRTSFTAAVLDRDFVKRNADGNLMHTLSLVPGVRSMDIGSGMSKPMIRGMAFNRIAVVENGVKQEGQQWGTDHALEMDALNVEQVTVLKGPASLFHGSDALGGVVEIQPPSFPVTNQVEGEALLLAKSVNRLLGGSLMLSVAKDSWFVKARYSEQHYGDYRIPADTVVYLTQSIPVLHKKLKNTAGLERHVSLQTLYRRPRYRMATFLSKDYLKAGFFPGAHGIPDISRVTDDGNSRNVELPFSEVHHLKMTTRHTYLLRYGEITANLGYQRNRRREWSAFHTHYDGQAPPEKNPDLELGFLLDTYNASLHFQGMPCDGLEFTGGLSGQGQTNRIEGYSFLLPEYRRLTVGVFLTSLWRMNERLTFLGGMRYDWGTLHASPFADPFLEQFLEKQGYALEEIAAYHWRSYPVDRHFGDCSWAFGLVWTPSWKHLFKVNAGRSFRIPGANELASNGVHHGTFRHEQGDPLLHSEKGWQLDLSYEWHFERGSIEITPFVSFYKNFIYLDPVGEWSVLPHAGQIYRYRGTKALLGGGELAFSWRFLPGWSYRFSGEYVSNHNLKEQIALSFTPPAAVRQTLTRDWKRFSCYAESLSLFAQRRVDRNEDPTPGATILNLGVSAAFPKCRVRIVVGNLLNRKYFNHLSYYRKIEIPESGRNFLLTLQLPFKQLLK